MEGGPAARPFVSSRRGMAGAHADLSAGTARVGVRMAFEGAGSKRESSPWPALLGAAAAVTGVVAIVTVNHGLTDAVTHPQVAGVAWDASVQPVPSDISLTGSTLQSSMMSPSNRASLLCSSIARYVSQIGDLGVPVFTVIDRAAGTPVHLVTLSGRAPEADDEIVLGPSTAHDLGVKTGDTVNLADGGSAKVVGLGLFPSDVHAQFDEGAMGITEAVERARRAELQPRQQRDRGDGRCRALHGSRRPRQADRAPSRPRSGSTVQFVGPAEQPLELVNLHNVRQAPDGAGDIPRSARSCCGRPCVVLLRLPPPTRFRSAAITRQSPAAACAGMITAQATVVGLAGLLIGVPIGLIAGRAGWQAIANRVPLTFRSPLTVIAVLVVVPVALIAANLLAIIPARRASKAKPALVLRSE